MPVYRSLPITISGSQVLFADGTAAAPSMSFSADTNTGIFRSGADYLSFTANGVTTLHYDGNGPVLGNSASASGSPGTGTIRGTYGGGTNIAGAPITIIGGRSTGNAAGGHIAFQTSAAGSSGSSPNTLTERMRITSEGYVGIGTNAPARALTVAGTDSNSSAVRIERSGSGTNWEVGVGSDGRLAIAGNAIETAISPAHQFRFADGTAAAPVLSFSADTDTGVYRPGTNILAFSTNGVGKMTITATGEVVVGQGHNGGTPVAGSVIGAAGSGTNIAGANLTIAGGNSTGTGAGGELIFQTAAAGSSGSAANTLTERMRITSGGTIYFGNGDFSATPTASTLRGTNGQGTNIAGAELVLQAGAGTGNAASGAITFRTATAGASGTGVNGSSDRMRIKTNGQVRFVPLAADPAGAEAGDVYYNSGTNKLKVYNGTAWVDLH